MRNLKLKILVAFMVLAGTGSGVSKDQGPMDIEDFVRQVYIHGVPYEEASRYHASVIPTLLKMLGDPKEQDHWSNIVVTLGMIGDEGAVEPMIGFIERSEGGTLNRSQRQAKRSAIMSLGYLINKSGSQKALDYLTTGLIPQKGTELATAMTERDGSLNKYAVLGLALSGHSQATKVLKSIAEVSKSIRESPDKVERVLANISSANIRELMSEALRTSKEMVVTEMSSSGVRELVSGALDTSKKIADKGLAGYYRSLHP